MGGEQLTLRVAAAVSDRWNLPGGSPETFEHKVDVLAGHCESVGRSVDDVEKSTLQTAVIRETTEAAHDAYERIRDDAAVVGSEPRDEYRGLIGTPAEVCDRLDTFGDFGAEMVMLRAEANDAETIDYLVDDVVPELR